MDKELNNILYMQDKCTRIQNKTVYSKPKDINNKDKEEEYSVDSNEYITKGRKTLYNPSMIHLQSPKKVNPTRNRRITLFKSSTKREIQEFENEIKKNNNFIDFNNDILSNVTFGEPSQSSSKILSDFFSENNSFNNNKYKMLVKKIAKILKKRVKFPKCKIFKFYNSYRTLILRIASGIKKTAKKLNFWEKWENKNNITEKEIFEIQEIASTSCKIIQQKNNESKKVINIKLSTSKKNNKNTEYNLSLFKKNTEKEELNKNEDKNEIYKNIDFLKNLDTSINNNNYISQLSDFLQRNNIEICPETKIPLFKKDNTKYLLSNIDFWIKYIIFISRKYKDSLSIYNFIDYIEIFYLWKDKNTYYNYDNFNNEIIKQISLLFNKSTIDNFLLIYKINNLNDLFKRYKNNYIDNYREIKVEEECQCETCKNSFYEKIVDYNKKNNCIILSKENNLSYIINNNKNEKKRKTNYQDKELLDYFSINKNEEDEEERNNRKNSERENTRQSKSKEKNGDNSNKNNEIIPDDEDELEDIINNEEINIKKTKNERKKSKTKKRNKKNK